MGEILTVAVSDGVATLTLHRPHRKNAWTLDMERDLFAAMDRADADQDASEQPQWRTHRLYHARLLRKPVIAAINGACAGVGVVLAVSSDIRFTAESAKFATSFTRRGMPVEGGLPWMLPR